MSDYPLIFRVRQTFERPRVDDVPGEVDSQLSALSLANRIRPGDSVALTAGSRGIANIHIIIRAIVDHLKNLGAEPFIVPAMGSHGGGTAEGQLRIIESYGITESYCGCPIRAGMETVIVTTSKEGFPIHFDKHAYGADHVVVCGRVKPHTLFFGDIESGLMKMMLIGLGKHEGAKVYHRAIKDYSFGQIVRSVAEEVRSRCGVVAGVAIVENGFDETARISAVAPHEFEEREKELLLLAKKWLPTLPFDSADVLLIDEIGKDISGTGFDTNVVGRKFLYHQAREDEYPKVRIIGVRDLTAATHGNATGIGRAEFCLTRVVEKMDVQATRINCLTSGDGVRAMVPLDYPTDRELLDTMLPLIGLTPPAEAKLLWIRNTLDVAEVECSQIYFDEARKRDDLEICTDLRPLPLDTDGMLPNMRQLPEDGPQIPVDA